MKRVIAIMMAMLMLAGTTACQSGNSSDNTESTGAMESATPSLEAEERTEAAEESQSADDDDWGVWVSLAAENENRDLETIYIQFPEFGGVSYGTGKGAYQYTPTLVFFDSQGEDSPSVESVDKVLPAYQEKMVNMIDKYRSDWDYENMQIEITSQENVEINGYEMCRYEGIHTFTYDGVAGQCQFVAYAALLKNIDAYAYWFVLDDSEDQSQYDVCSENAEKMAWTLEEKFTW